MDGCGSGDWQVQAPSQLNGGSHRHRSAVQGLVSRGAYNWWVQRHVVQAQYVKVSCFGLAAVGLVSVGWAAAATLPGGCGAAACRLGSARPSKPLACLAAPCAAQDPYRLPDYLASSLFLADINNEVPARRNQR